MNEEGQAVESTVSRIIRHEIVRLLVLSILGTVAFLGTRAAATWNRDVQARTAAVWYERGQRAMAAGDLQEAIDFLRRATATARDNPVYSLALAEALASAQKDEEADQILLRLRERTPENPKINLQLARIAAKRGSVAEATRYYHSALYGVWPGESGDEERRQVRIELTRFLLQHGARDLALSELLAYSGDLPPSAAAQIQAGELFLEAADPAQALAHFTSALKQERASDQAFLGAGKAEFQLGDYAHARRYLASVKQGALVEEASELLAVTNVVLENDPVASGIGAQERRRRLRACLQGVLQRLQECLAQPPGADIVELQALLQEAQALEPSLKSWRRLKDEDVIPTVLDLVYRTEQQSDRICGTPSSLDRGLALIAENYLREHQP
ncbi:MAG TPA: tetratricopeptide repeat protein [Terriglobales bacterium]|nr:tetratricopeptide repeat protein [Terriglobales bacterium]